MAYSTNIVYLSKAQYQELLTNQTITVNGTTVTYNENDIYVTPQAEPVTDVRVNGTSVNNNGIANIPIGGSNTPGVFMTLSDRGTAVSNGKLEIVPASDNQIKNGNSSYRSAATTKQHTATFYGLAKAAGDSTQSASSNAVGIYTDDAKQKIQNMLGITDLLSTEETTTATAAHALNSTFMMNGKLHRATAAIAIGDAVEVGTNCEVVKADEVFVKNTDYATSYTGGIIRIGSGLQMAADGKRLYTRPATSTKVKAGADSYDPIVPTCQDQSVFYGLSKVAGVDLANETVTLGTYPETSKTAIRSMLGAASPNVIAVQDEQPTDTETKVWLPETEATGIQVPTMEDMANYVLKTDYATSSAPGIVQISKGDGIGISSSAHTLYVNAATSALVKAGTDEKRPIVPSNQHEAVFYGLAKVAGDATQAASENAVGTYTSGASAAIRSMLGTAAISNTVLENSISLGRKADTNIGTKSVALGQNVSALGACTFAIGLTSTAHGTASFASGGSTLAEGAYSHAEGLNSIANGGTSHAEGYSTIAEGARSHVFGQYNIADNYNNWPEWTANTSYIIGDKIKKTTISNENTIINGYICTVNNNDEEFDLTHWKGENRINFIEIAGNGIAENDRSNAYALDWDGNGHFAGNIYVGCNADSTGGTRVPHDIQINGTSVVSSGVANIPIASENIFGVLKIGSAYSGLQKDSSGYLKIAGASSAYIKNGTDVYMPIVSGRQHESVFYGLAKASGDTTQFNSSNVVGTYTDSAKASIKSMLGIVDGSTGTVDITGTTPTITAVENTRYVCGEITTLSFTPSASGICIVRFTSGSTPTVVTIPNTVKFPEWFDITALEADTIYEICVTDGIYGAVMSWAL